MKNVMRSLLLSLTIITLSHFSGQAQLHIGTGAAFPTQLADAGLNLRLQVDIADIGDGRLAVTPNATYYFVEPSVTWLELNVDFSYLLGNPDVIVGYPIVGLRRDVNIISVLGQSRSTGFSGLNAGLGTQYSLGDNLKVYLEGKYLSGTWNRFVFGLGVMAKIGR